ncbi:MAG TPA: DNA translocase FtsK 4TM domain-containing protein, partial [Pyrinomonadaceae bacterium]
MATTQAETRTRLAATNRGPRLGEITGILLLALGLLLALCLFFFHPDDPSLNSAGRSETNNLIGPAGAYVSDLALQPFGVAAYLLPVLLFAAAWRRFSKRPLRAPLGRVAGLLVVLLSASALLALAGLPRLFDGRVEAGGFVGLFVAGGLAGVIGNVGALVVLAALASIGVLLATNFSFAHAYERTRAALGDPSGYFGTQAARLRAW